MVSIPVFRQMALGFAEATEEPHFEKTSFRVKKKIFATLDTDKKRVVVKFSPEDQYAFGAYDSEAIYPLPNKWGQQGWTAIELTKVRKDVLKDAIQTSYCTVAPKTLAALYRNDEL